MDGGLASCLFQFTGKCVHGGILILVTAGHFPVNETQYVFNVISLSRNAVCQQVQGGQPECGCLLGFGYSFQPTDAVPVRFQIISYVSPCFKHSQRVCAKQPADRGILCQFRQEGQ